MMTLINFGCALDEGMKKREQGLIHIQEFLSLLWVISVTLTTFDSKCMLGPRVSSVGSQGHPFAKVAEGDFPKKLATQVMELSIGLMMVTTKHPDNRYLMWDKINTGDKVCVDLSDTRQGEEMSSEIRFGVVVRAAGTNILSCFFPFKNLNRRYRQKGVKNKTLLRLRRKWGNQWVSLGWRVTDSSAYLGIFLNPAVGIQLISVLPQANSGLTVPNRQKVTFIPFDFIGRLGFREAPE